MIDLARRRRRRRRVAGALSLLLLAAAGVGCERIVDIDLEEGPTRLVVAGRIELIREAPSPRQEIRLTTTAAFFSNAPPPPAVGAMVTVSDGPGPPIAFTETAPGLYETDGLPAAIGSEYTLRIEWGGDTYESVATARSVPPVDALYFVFEEETIIMETEGFRATIDYFDPPGVENFYLWEQIVDGELALLPDPGNAFNLISKDEFYDGQPVLAYQPNHEVALLSGQHVSIRQIALSREAYTYYSALFEQNALGSGDPFSIPPANVRGNVENLTTPGRLALGFFEAAEVSVASAIVSDQPPSP